MRNDLVTTNTKIKPKIICEALYRVAYYLGNKLYKLSEKCVYFSKLRDRKIALDKEYEERNKVGEMILDNESIADEIIQTGGQVLNCKDTLREVGKHHIDNKRELQYCHETVYALWEAYCELDVVEMEKIFSNIGLKKEIKEGAEDERVTK